MVLDVLNPNYSPHTPSTPLIANFEEMNQKRNNSHNSSRRMALLNNNESIHEQSAFNQSLEILKSNIIARHLNTLTRPNFLNAGILPQPEPKLVARDFNDRCFTRSNFVKLKSAARSARPKPESHTSLGTHHSKKSGEINEPRYRSQSILTNRKDVGISSKLVATTESEDNLTQKILLLNRPASIVPYPSRNSSISICVPKPIPLNSIYNTRETNSNNSLQLPQIAAHNSQTEAFKLYKQSGTNKYVSTCCVYIFLLLFFLALFTFKSVLFIKKI